MDPYLEFVYSKQVQLGSILNSRQVNGYPVIHKISYYSSNSADLRALLTQKREFIDNARRYIESYQFLIYNIRTNNFSRYLERMTVLEIEIQIERDRIKNLLKEKKERENLLERLLV